MVCYRIYASIALSSTDTPTFTKLAFCFCLGFAVCDGSLLKVLYRVPLAILLSNAIHCNNHASVLEQVKEIHQGSLASTTLRVTHGAQAGIYLRLAFDTVLVNMKGRFVKGDLTCNSWIAVNVY